MLELMQHEIQAIKSELQNIKKKNNAQVKVQLMQPFAVVLNDLIIFLQVSWR